MAPFSFKGDRLLNRLRANVLPLALKGFNMVFRIASGTPVVNMLGSQPCTVNANTTAADCKVFVQQRPFFQRHSNTFLCIGANQYCCICFKNSGVISSVAGSTASMPQRGQSAVCSSSVHSTICATSKNSKQ